MREPAHPCRLAVPAHRPADVVAGGAPPCVWAAASRSAFAVARRRLPGRYNFTSFVGQGGLPSSSARWVTRTFGRKRSSTPKPAIARRLIRRERRRHAPGFRASYDHLATREPLQSRRGSRRRLKAADAAVHPRAVRNLLAATTSDRRSPRIDAGRRRAARWRGIDVPA